MVFCDHLAVRIVIIEAMVQPITFNISFILFNLSYLIEMYIFIDKR